jgi:hypothetical protein
MHNRITWIGLLAISLAGMVGTEAMARVCVLRSSSGQCKVWSGTISCEDLNASGVGNVVKDPKSMGCRADALPGIAFTVIAFCANQGGNVAPGVSGILASPLSGQATIFPSQVDKNGFAKGINVKASPTPEQLAEADQACRDALNSNWFAVDVVPIDTLVSVNVIDDMTGEITQSASFECHLPNPDSLGWNKKANAPERRRFDCVEQ